MDLTRGITNFAVRRWQVTLVAFMLLVLLGSQAFFAIPRSVDPHFPTPFAVATVVMPGADALDMEEAVAKPIEGVLQGLDHVREIRSLTTEGLAVVSVEFEHGTDAEQSLDRVEREVGAIRDRLPEGIARISFRRPRTTEAGVLQLALVSDQANWRRMVKYADDLRDRLNVVPGVRTVAIDGAAAPEVRVALDTERLAQAAIPASTVATAITQSGIDLPAGSVDAGTQRYLIDAGGAYRSLDAVRAVPIRAGDGRLVRVGDVAEIGWSEAEQLHITRFNGHRALFVTVRQKDGVDAGHLRNALVAKTGSFVETLPPDMRLEIGFDQSHDIERKLAQLTQDFLIGLALVLVTILPLGFRPSLIVMISIPLSLATGVLILWLTGYSLNQISISGFIISLGLLVDDSIVVIENIERHLRGGAPPVEAAIEGTREISAAVTGATGVLLFAFLPLVFLPESSGDFVRGLPVAVIATVASSLLVSLTIIPFVASRTLKPHEEGGNALLHWLMQMIQRGYAPLLRHALDRPRRWFWAAMVLCVGALALVPVLGFSLFPAAETPYFLIRVELPEGSSIAATDRVVARVSAVIARESAVVNRMENTGAGNPQIFYNVMPRDERARYGDIFVTLQSWDVVEGPRLIERLRRTFDRDADAQVTVLDFENGPPVEAPVAVRVSGPDLSILKSLSDRVAAEMERLPGLRYVSNPIAFDRVDLDLGLDEARAGLLGVAPGEARRALRLAISGETASRFRDNEGDSWPVTVRLPMGTTQPVSALSKVYVPTLAGSSVPLLEVAHPRLKSVVPQITRFKFQRTVTVSAYAVAGHLPSQLTAQVAERLRSIALPPGYSFEFGGEAETASRNFAGLGGIILFAVFGILGVLVVEFGRFRETAVVASVIPLGTFGGLVVLLLTGNSLSFFAVIGFVALIGIEIKNSILLIDFTTQLRARGLHLRDAIEKAGEIRFLPVLLTSATAIGGLLPLAIAGSALYSPLSWVIIGGLVSSTLLSRIVTPVAYLLAVRRTTDAAVTVSVPS